MLWKSHMHSELSGSIGGITYSHGRYGPYGRARVVPVNVNTTELEIARAFFSASVARWKTLTAVQQQSWIDFAAGTPWTNKLGETVFLTGQAMYIGQTTFSQNLFPGYTLVAYDVAPCVPGLFPQPLVTFACCNTPDLGVIVTVQNLDSTFAMSAIVRISRPISTGVRFHLGPYKSADSILLNAISAGSTDDAEFCDLCAARYFFEVRCWDETNGNNMSSLTHGSFDACTAAV